MNRFSYFLALLTLALAAPLTSAGGPAEIKPFKIAVDESVLRDLKDRLARTRFPDQIEDAGWDYGVELNYFKALVGHWRDKYDWRAVERKLNELPQFTTEIDGLKVHFVHQRSKEKNALPLVLLHGWPGSFYEFSKVVGPLTDPVAHGGKAEDAFHVVVPSLPGYGFSGRPREKGWSVNRMSEVIAKLMERLGYERYGAHGGDWGSNIANWLGGFDTKHVAGVHMTFIGYSQPKGDPWAGITAKEKERLEKRRDELQNERAYGAIQGTKPQTLGYALNDSPAGLAAWIVDRFRAWSDHRGNLENSFTKDELLTNVMLYWVTETAASSARIYHERQYYNGGRKGGRAPVGITLFPKEINLPPRKWVEGNYNLIYWSEPERGGHFAALEVPDLFVREMRAFFGKVR